MNRSLSNRIARLERMQQLANVAESTVAIHLRPQISRTEWLWLHNPELAKIEHAAGVPLKVEPNAARTSWWHG